MTLYGIGIDLVEISRVRELLDRWGERFYSKVFIREEIAYCLEKADPAASFAARFAAKEAFAKALGTGIGEACGWKDFAVLPGGGERPRPWLSPRVRQRLGECRVHVSLSHTNLGAVALVVIEVENATGR